MAGGNQCRADGHQNQNRGDNRQCNRVGRRDLVKEARQGTAKRERYGESYRDADQRDSRRLSKQHRNHRCRAGPQRDANPDLLYALAHRVICGAIDSDSGQNHGNRGEHSQEQSLEPARRHQFVKALLHGGDAGNGSALVHGTHLGSQSGSQLHRA